MVRLIDIREQNTGYSFAFFDTVKDKFITLGGNQVWNNRSEFLESGSISDPLFNRCLSLVPDWADGENGKA